jgi:hypothetical protein
MCPSMDAMFLNCCCNISIFDIGFYKGVESKFGHVEKVGRAINYIQVNEILIKK